MRDGHLADTLQSGLGRRILGLFMLAALLPVIFTTYLSYNEVHRGLKQQVTKTLQENAKSYGVEMLARLSRAADRANALLRIIGERGHEFDKHTYLLDGFEAIWVQDGSFVTANIVGTNDSPIPLDSLNQDHLRTGQTQLIRQSEQGNEALILVVSAATGGVSERFMFRLDSQRIWGPWDNLPYMTQFCVFATEPAPVFCTDDFTVDAATAASLAVGSHSGEPTEYPAGNETFFIASWQLLLDGLFAATPIDIVAGQPASYALRSSADFRKVLPPALALVMILVAVLSLLLIGDSLDPLKKLKLLVGQYAGGDLNSRVRLRTGDEFQALGETFNYMADQIALQIDTLKAMSEIDRLILDGAEFEEVGEKVINSLIGLIHCEAAGIIARDSDSPAWAKMITYFDKQFSHERIATPQDVDYDWSQPQQLEIGLANGAVAPYEERFQEYGQTYVVTIPVVRGDILRGILLLGSATVFEMRQANMQRCVDLAGRLAVALASAEREESLYRQAHFDELTGLPNRQLLKDRLQQQIIQARRDERSGALLFLDLDRFKEINDTYGHSTGDKVLVQAAERIVAEASETDTVARLGGDEFVVILPAVHDDLAVRDRASRLLQRLSEPFSVREDEHFVSASIGIALFPDDGDSVETLLKNADAAMYRAKDAGRSRFEFCGEQLNVESRRRIELEHDLRDAIRNGLLQVYYQPQLDLGNGAICGAEALLRWQHPSKGFVPADEFVPLAEDAGLIIEIGRWVLVETCRNLKSIMDKGLHPGAVSINVSGMQLRDTQFIDDVLQPLQKYGVHPGFVHLEITETAVAENRDIAIHVLKTLRGKGVKIAIDDFGTGNSSLSYLQQLPFDLINIDKSFVDLIGSGDHSEMICRTIIKMAIEMGKPALAEGVETREQVDFLKANGCNLVQGFFYSEPLSPHDFLAFIKMQDFHTQRRKTLELI